MWRLHWTASEHQEIAHMLNVSRMTSVALSSVSSCPPMSGRYAAAIRGPVQLAHRPSRKCRRSMLTVVVTVKPAGRGRLL